jgi:hypothetical protein
MTTIDTVPDSPEAARSELEQLAGWVNQFQQMQAQLPHVQARAAFLTGWLAAHAGGGESAPPVVANRATRRAESRKRPKPSGG